MFSYLPQGQVRETLTSDPLSMSKTLSDPEDTEVLCSNSDPAEPEVEDDELRVATRHLTQDFLCQVIQEEEGRGKAIDDGKQETGPQRQAAPLAVILGKLQSAAGLDLQQTVDETETEENPDSKN